MTEPKDRDNWSEPVGSDDAANEPDSPIDDKGAAELGDATAPEPGLADTAPQSEAEKPRGASHAGDEPPPDDEREHPADFAADGYDDRQTDSPPRMPAE